MREEAKSAEARAQPEPAATAGPTWGPVASPSETVLRLQATIGNRATTRLVQRSVRAERQMVQRGVLDALGHGLDVYTGIPDSDPGKKFAQELMRWRVLGAGQMFVKHGSADPDWNTFMLERPELQRAMLAPFKELAEEQAALGPSGSEWSGGYRNISKDITGVKLNELESMRLTLHGCHRIEIRGRANVAAEGGDFIVKLWPQMTWVDRAAMHPGTTTELDSGKQIDDSSFTAAGWDYDERIMFELVGSVLAPDASSKWKVSGGVATHVAGWPPEGSVPQGGRRG
jgi:hypothetical protein